MVTVYGFKTFNTTKVLLTAEELGVAYQYVHLDPTKAEHKSPEHMVRHPLGKVPAIEHEGKALFEGNTICRYLAVMGNHPMYSGDAWHKAKIDQWVDLIAQHLGRWMAQVFFQECIRGPVLGKSIDQEALDEAKGFLSQQIPVIENQLEGRDFFMGDQITIADTIAFCFFNLSETTSISLEDYPNLKRWHDAIKQRPSFARAMANYPA